MLKIPLLFLAACAIAFAQGTTDPGAFDYVRFGGGAKTVGYCLTWDASGRAISALCGAGGSGEANTSSNLGSGVGLAATKSGVNLPFKSLLAGSARLSISGGANEVTLDVVQASLSLSAIGGSLNIAQINASGTPNSTTFLRGDGTWVNVGGGGGGPANTDALSEGVTNLYFTNARARAALSASGLPQFNSSTGVISCPDCVGTSGSYANPSWITSLAWAKLTGVPTYQLVSEKGVANGYPELNASALIPTVRLGTGTASSAVYLRGDNTWATPAGLVNLMVDGSSIGTRPALNLIEGAMVTISPTDDPGNNRVNVVLDVDSSVLNSTYLRLNAPNAMGGSGTIDMSGSPGTSGFRPPDETECVATTNGYLNWATNALRLCAGDGTNSNPLAYLKDTPRGNFTVVRTSGTVATVNGTASASYPAIARIGSTTYSFTSAGTVTLSGTACSGTVLWYISSAGAITAGHNALTCTFTGSGVTVATPITAFPADSIPIATATISSGAWNTTITDQRSMLSAAPTFTGSGDAVVSQTGGNVNISVSSGSSVTANAPYMVVGGTPYLPFMSAATYPPTVSGGGWSGRNAGTSTFTQVGNSIVFTSDTAAPNAWNVQGINIGSTTTLIAAIALQGQNAGSNYARCAIGVQKPSGNLVLPHILAKARDDGTSFTLQWQTSPTAAGTGYGTTGSAVDPSMVWIRIQLTGGNVVASYSHFYNGASTTWTPMGTIDQATGLSGSVISTDQWIIAVANEGTHPTVCTLLSWSAT